ncbi:DUF3037 domain-containing protein [Polluticaenibacter yanchengensis]|uniref:DUF3037 domain-containing protein n=1 Tax=Polluticaenibacter yanchengensis TaxID=3014562 RepID=A0ABT4UKU4_9BACT|nr:DUF3037 domain-containing protein [Chitinophagaceae bacterium LY-5]
MQESNVFEYTVLRLVPRVEREEFINIGVILFCKKKKFLGLRYEVNENKIKAIAGEEVCLDTIKEHLKSFERITNGDKCFSLIASYDLAERYRWLTAKRSTIIQTSATHAGVTANPAETLEKIYNEQVL